MSGVVPSASSLWFESMSSQVFLHHLTPCLGLQEHRALPCVSRGVRSLRQPPQPPNSLLHRPIDTLTACMSFLDYRDLTAMALSHRRLEVISRHPDAHNPQYRMAAHLSEHGDTPLIPVYQSPAYMENHGRGSPPSTMPQMVGTNYLSVLRGGTLLLKELPNGREFKVFFNEPIERCHPVDLPEPALVIGNHISGMKVITLEFLLNNQNALLIVNRLPTLIAPEAGDGGEQVSVLGSTPLDWFINRDQSMASQGNLVAIAYRDYVMVANLLHPARGCFLPFSNAHQIGFHEQNILCLSTQECDVFSLDSSNVEGSFQRIFHVKANPVGFFVAKLFASRVAVGYENYIGWGIGRAIGASYNLRTEERTLLLNAHHARGELGLFYFIENGAHLIGGSSRFSQWGREGGLPAPFPQDSPLNRVWQYDVRTIAPLGDCVFSATAEKVFLHLSRDFLNARDITRKFLPREDGSKIILAKIWGRFLITEIMKYRESDGTRDHFVQVYDLLQEPQEAPTSAGPLPTQPRSNSDDQKENEG